MVIAYDRLLDGLPERVAEVALRVRDLVLSLGPGVSDAMKGSAAEFWVEGKFATLTATARGVLLKLHGPLTSPLPDWGGRLLPKGKSAVLTFQSAADVDEELRRILREAYARAASQGRPHKTADVPGLPPALKEALGNLSRGLRSWMHTLAAAEKTEKHRAASAAQGPHKRSHKKRAHATPPPLFMPQELPGGSLVPQKTAPLKAAAKKDRGGSSQRKR